MTGKTKQEKQRKTTVILLTLVTAVLVTVSTVFLVKKTGFAASIASGETRRMLCELAVLFLVLFVSGLLSVKKAISRGIRIAAVLVYLWLHRILLPLLAAGLFLGYLYLLGGTVTGRIFAGKRAGAAGLITGMAVQILIVCIFSACGIGGTGFFLAQSCICFVLLTVIYAIAAKKKGLRSVRDDAAELLHYVFPQYRNGETARITQAGKPDSTDDKTSNSEKRIFCFLAALIAASLLLQAGRIGICLDYDSLHYGFRSAYVLDAGNGIYENLGSVNDVYVYPKGFEILTLPLAGFGSGAFVSAFSWWMTLVTLGGAAALTDPGESRRRGIPAGMYAAAVLSTVPGIMNMAVSAKTDAVTLAVQTLCILCFLREEKAEWWAGLAAALLSLTFKPTSFLFSFLLTAAGIIFCVYRILAERKAMQNDPGSDGTVRTGAASRLITAEELVPAAFALAAALFVTARTVQLAGVPLTTAGGGLWNALGFELKYPFNGASIGGGTEKNLFKRIIGVFACPVGQDMSHVYIAWGGLAVPICLAAVILAMLFGRKEKRKAGQYCLAVMLLLTAAASLFLIRSLWQLDGNYFMLLYLLAVVCTYSFLRDCRAWTVILSPAMLLGAAMCVVTNWAGVPGLTPAGVLHAGYPEQQKEDRLRLEAEGKGEIYRFLAEDPSIRVLAMADQPGCFAFPCNVQSYTDLEGSGGNVKLVKTLNEFKDFLDYAGTDYIYVEQPFLSVRERATDIVRYMLEDGSLVEEIAAGGSGTVLYRYTGLR